MIGVFYIGINGHRAGSISPTLSINQRVQECKQSKGPTYAQTVNIQSYRNTTHHCTHHHHFSHTFIAHHRLTHCVGISRPEISQGMFAGHVSAACLVRNARLPVQGVLLSFHNPALVRKIVAHLCPAFGKSRRIRGWGFIYFTVMAERQSREA